MSRKVQLLCAWSFVPFAVLFGVGFVVLAGFIPPPHPTDSAQEIKAMYQDDLTGIRVGMCLVAVSVVFLATWGSALAMQTRRIEAGVPVLTYVQVACFAVVTLIGELIALVFAVAAFRPDDVSADITRMLNDLGWFLFLFDWPPVALWYVAVGVAILRDQGEPPIFPRWAGYFSFWVAVLSVPSSLIVFFKHGAFGFNGVLALYVPVAVLFAWFIVMTALVIQAIDRERDEAVA